MVSIILGDNCPFMQGKVIFYADRLTNEEENLVFYMYNYVILTQVSVAPQRHQLSFSMLV
jgi:hypothetical protein